MSLSGIMTKSLLSANSSMQTARVQQSAKKQMDGRAGVLNAEINLDGARGGDTKKKQEALEETKKKASALEETAINTLNVANEDMKKAAKEDQEVQRAEKAAEKKKTEKAAEKKKAAKEAAEERIEKIAESTAIETVDAVQITSPDGKMQDSASVDVVVDSVTPSTVSAESIGAKLDIKA